MNSKEKLSYKESRNIYLKKKMNFFGYQTNKSSINLIEFLEEC